MSAPNKQYDPVEVAVLSPEQVAGMRDAALAAIAAAGDLDELKTARLAHAGDRSPLALANAEIGALPPEARAEAGKRVGAARRDVAQALAARQEELEADRDQRALAEEAVDVTLPWDRAGQGARHPVTTLAERPRPACPPRRGPAGAARRSRRWRGRAATGPRRARAAPS